MDAFNTFLAFFGIVLGFAGVALTFVTFFAPDHVLRLALRSREGWRTIPSVREGTQLYRHKTLSGYTIEVDLSDPVTEGFDEYWMGALFRPDMRANTYYVTVYFNGLPVEREMFLAYDGSRNFIPVPQFSVRNDRRFVSFSPQQRQLANIVGYDSDRRDFDEVAAAIVQSRFNPEPLVFQEPYSGLIDELDKKIKAFRARM